jgi:hypothetical protein
MAIRRLKRAQKIKPVIRRTRRLIGPLPQNNEVQAFVSQEKYIFNHPKFSTIINAMREGIPLREIARWFSREQWIEINEETFFQYLHVFRRRNLKLVESQNEEFIDHLVHANQPNIDVKSELNRLFRLQKLRLKIDVQTEKEMGKLFNTTHREVEKAHEILETIAKMDGHLGIGGGGREEAVAISEDVRDELESLTRDEAKRNNLTTLAGQLIRTLNDKKDKAKASA